MTPQPIKNSVLLKIDNALIDEITTEGGLKLYIAPEYNFEENVTISGEISVLPSQSSTWNIKRGDNVAFSYHVVANRTFPNTSNWFVPVSEGSEYISVWMNSKGEKVRKLARPGVISLIWTGSYFDSRGRFIDGCQGSEKDVDRWLSQFKFGTAETFLYKNKLTINNSDYWKCSFDKIFAKKVGDEIVAVGDRVICDIIKIPIDRRVAEINGIKLPEGKIDAVYYDRGKVVSGGEKLGLKKGDVVHFSPDFCEKYNLWGKHYFLIKEKRINGVFENFD